MKNISFRLPEIDIFIQDFFQKKPFMFQSIDGYEMVDWQAINRLLEKDILDFPRVRLANDNNPSIRGYKGFVNYSLTVTGETSPHINRYNLLKSLQGGSTLIVDRCQAFFEGALHATQYLNERLRCRSSANLYCAWSATPSFGVHFDNNDVIAVQIEGVKKWDIYAPTRHYPLLSEKSFDHTPPTGSPIATYTVSPGQAIYLPAGYWHNVFTESERSMHLSFPLVRPRKIDVIRSILSHLEDSPEMRHPIAYSKDIAENAKLSGILYSYLANVDIDQWESAIIEDCMNTRNITFNLPEIRTRDA
ncbi:cupin domain-containing protein [Pseudomonas sp. MAFF 302030]|uniref:Cupin domain-containing protein n=1 Tax=Pseudomonas morbosilactucae TaxID=2938197 RepID=A0A9X1YV87_9PSED|nr:cupin domain-containing protein [Pseudomonas morbosilactucae]MCK9798853.1 cupin domain-containing protein [Pseudomonas morbosilactucae]